MKAAFKSYSQSWDWPRDPPLHAPDQHLSAPALGVFCGRSQNSTAGFFQNIDMWLAVEGVSRWGVCGRSFNWSNLRKKAGGFKGFRQERFRSLLQAQVNRRKVANAFWDQTGTGFWCGDFSPLAYLLVGTFKPQSSYSSPTITFTPSKCTSSECFPVYSQHCTSVTTTWFPNISLTPRRIPTPLPYSLSPCQPPSYFLSPWICQFIEDPDQHFCEGLQAVLYS